MTWTHYFTVLVSISLPMQGMDSILQKRKAAEVINKTSKAFKAEIDNANTLELPEYTFTQAIKGIIDQPKARDYNDLITTLLKNNHNIPLNDKISTWQYGKKTPLQILGFYLCKCINEKRYRNSPKVKQLIATIYTLAQHGANPYLKDSAQQEEQSFVELIDTTKGNFWLMPIKTKAIEFYENYSKSNISVAVDDLKPDDQTQYSFLYKNPAPSI